jgi:hypothetical protein
MSIPLQICRLGAVKLSPLGGERTMMSHSEYVKKGRKILICNAPKCKVHSHKRCEASRDGSLFWIELDLIQNADRSRQLPIIEGTAPFPI